MSSSSARRGESGQSDDVAPSRGHDGPSVPRPHRGEDPGHDGPEGEHVGEDEMTDEATGRVAEKSSKPDLGMGASLIPEHDTPDGNPIDPRVF